MLCKAEFIAMNNPVRRYVQKHVEFNIFNSFLKKHNISLTGKAILDAGCGSGYGTELIYKAFRPSRLVAFDIMPEQIDIARRRALCAEISVGDMTRTGLPPDSFDAIFVFGVLHHLPAWRVAQKELARALKAGGALLVEELDRRAVNFFEQLGFAHPKEAGFDFPEFEDGLRRAGFDIIDQARIFGVSGMKSFLCVKRG